MKTSLGSRILLAASVGLTLISSASAITIGFGTDLVGVQDTPSDGTTNQMRQNINITDTVFLSAGIYRATTWDYQAAPDATNGAAQPVFPFLTLVNGPANHTVLAFGATIDTEPGVQTMVPFGGADDTFTVGAAGATIAAGIQNTNADSVQNSILTNTSFGVTDHANGLLFDEAGGVDASLVSFGHANLPRTYAFSIEVVQVDDPNATPPMILGVSPVDNSTDVATGVDLVVTFDEPIVIGTGNITIKNLTNDTEVAIPVNDPQVSVDTVFLTINPTALLEGSTEYGILIDATAIDDTTGDSFTGISDEEDWSFTTATPDTTDPALASLNPANGAENVALGTNLGATFDESIKIGTGNVTIRNLTDGTQDVIPVGDAQIVASGSVLSINPTEDLVLGKNYAIQIDATAIDDLADNSFAGIADDTTWSFTTPIPVAGQTSIGPGSDITEATENDTPDQDRLNIDRTNPTTLAAGTYSVNSWEMNVVMSNLGGGEVTPMLLVGPPPTYSIIWLGTAYDPDVDGIQTAPEVGDFRLDTPADVYAGFFTTNQGSEIIGTDSDNSGTGFSATDHDNEFLAPTAVGEMVGDFSHANLGRTYAFNINVVPGSQADLSITEIIYNDGKSPSVEFTFNSLPDRTYTVQASTSLNATGEPGGWIELDDGLDSEGTETTYIDSQLIVSGPRVFYRVILNDN